MKILKKIYHIGMFLQFCFLAIALPIETRDIIPILYLFTSGFSLVFSFKGFPIYVRYENLHGKYKCEYTAVFNPWAWKKNPLTFAIGILFLCTLVWIIIDHSLSNLVALSPLFFGSFLLLTLGSWMIYKKSKFKDLEDNRLTLDKTKEIKVKTGDEEIPINISEETYDNCIDNSAYKIPRSKK